MDLGRTAIGTWSGGRFMHFGEPVPEDRLIEILRPGRGIDTVVTADVYGQGGADSMLGRALEGVGRSTYSVAGTVGHDFVDGERQGAKGFPRFSNPALRGEAEYADYLRRATEASLERVGVDSFDLLFLHNPDRIGYSSDTVWDAMDGLRDEGLTEMIGVAPGPANGFTLDLISCFERFGARLDWAMVILNPLEPWPGEMCLDAAAANHIKVLTRVVDYGGLFWDDVRPGHAFAEYDHRLFRPGDWVAEGCARIERMRPIAERRGLTPLQLACAWNLSHPAVESVVPTLIQEVGPDARPIEDKRAELAALPDRRLASEEIDEIRAIGDNSNCMALKGASPDNDGEVHADSWPLSAELVAAGRRWDVDPERDLRHVAAG
jgi:aryl-alcohol dehydrogenase-like predicted oxidoreductase